MVIFMNQLLHTSCMMAVIAAVYILAGALSNGKYFAGDFYYAGKMILLGFIIPFRPRIRVSFPLCPADSLFSEGTGSLQNIFTVLAEKSEAGTTAFIPVSAVAAAPVKIVFFVWLLVFFVVLFHHVMKYLSFKRLAERWSGDITDAQILKAFRETKKQLGITANLQIRKSACISSPMLIQPLKPVILLTDSQMRREDLVLILRHEMIHLKRKDLWFRWALLLAVAINWFNPAIYVFSKAFTCFCELSCDELVTENMPETGRYRYSMIIIHQAGCKVKSNTLFSSFSFGGKRFMKNRLFSIMNTTKKRWGAAMFAICLLSVFCAGMIFAVTDNERRAADTANTYIIKTEEDIDREIMEAFSEVFSNEFNENNFQGMIITYDDSGIPIVTDPDEPQKRAVYAGAKYEINGFYSSSDCSDSNLVFYVLMGHPIEVLDSSSSTAVAKVKYAGAGGYMKKSELKF